VDYGGDGRHTNGHTTSETILMLMAVMVAALVLFQMLIRR
jgi:hypothetical protein